MNIENCLFVGLSCFIALFFAGSIELPTLIIAGAFIGKFLPFWLQIIIVPIVLAVYRNKSSESDTSMKDIYKFFAICFFVTFVFGNVYYYSIHYLLNYYPVIKDFITKPFFTINFLR